MIKKILFKIALIAFWLTPSIALANTGLEFAKTTKSKTITKSFNVSSNATLEVRNSYGNLDIVTWDENRIAFDVTITVTGNNVEKIQERLNGIDVEFSSSNSLVSAITKIDKNKSNWWNWGKKMNLKIEINYRIKMPITNNVDLNNDYGAINLDKLNGKAKIRCDYGKITTKELMADGNEIRFDYTKNSYFEYIKSGKIVADYSSFTVAKAERLELNADYTKSVIEAAEVLDYNCDYGSLKIDNINTVDGNGDYLTFRLGNVYKSVNVEANYGSIKIERMASKAKSVTIDSEFVGITIGYDPSFNFNFDIDLDYASLRNGDGFNYRNKEVTSFRKKYNGYYGSENSGNMIKIKSEYGSVTFKKI